MKTAEKRRKITAWTGSVLVHGTVVLVAWLTAVGEPEPLEYVTYQVAIVSPPTEEETEEPAPAEDELVVETPDPEPVPPDPEPESEPVQEPEEEPEQAEPEQPEPTPAETPTETETEPDAEPEETGPDINVRMRGLQRDFPRYYRHIQIQINRCFRWNRGGRWEAAVDFVINADGSVNARDIDISQSSGNLGFDLAASGAVECARDNFDPLPDGLQVERLPVRFRFSPPGTPESTDSPAHPHPDDRRSRP